MALVLPGLSLSTEVWLVSECWVECLMGIALRRFGSMYLKIELRFGFRPSELESLQLRSSKHSGLLFGWTR